MNNVILVTKEVDNLNNLILTWGTCTGSEIGATGISLNGWGAKRSEYTPIIDDNLIYGTTSCGPQLCGLYTEGCEFLGEQLVPHNGIFNNGLYESRMYKTPGGKTIAVAGRRVNMEEYSFEELLKAARMGQKIAHQVAWVLAKRWKLTEGLPSAGLRSEGVFCTDLGSEYIEVTYRGGTGRTDHNINPPEYIVYGHEIYTHSWRIFHDEIINLYGGSKFEYA